MGNASISGASASTPAGPHRLENTCTSSKAVLDSENVAVQFGIARHCFPVDMLRSGSEMVTHPVVSSSM
jgi:hypothetical protein